MNIQSRTVLVCGFLAIAACHKENEPPKAADPAKLASTEAAPATTAAAGPQSTCADCNWEHFLDKPIRVSRIECTNPGGDKFHCHLETIKKEPERWITTRFDPATGGYSFTLETPKPGNEKDRVDCVNLVRDSDDSNIIEGTCAIGNAEHGTGVHFFKATVIPFEEDPSRPDIKFEFRHKPFSATASDPVHNGEGHGTD